MCHVYSDATTPDNRRGREGRLFASMYFHITTTRLAVGRRPIDLRGQGQPG